VVIKLNKPFDWLERRHNTHPVFTPCGYHKKNPPSYCRAEVEMTLFPFDDIHSEVQRIIEDDLLRLLRKDGVTSQVPDVRFIPIKLDVRRIHSYLSQVYLVRRYTLMIR
jgi:hypothetical protein